MSTKKVINVVSGLLLSTSWIYGSISGTVYVDSNLNNQQDSYEVGVRGVKLKATCSDGSSSTTTTDKDGKYLLNNTSGRCRVEADLSDLGYYAASNANGGNTLVGMVDDGVNNYDISVASPKSFLKDPKVYTVASPGSFDSNNDPRDTSNDAIIFRNTMPKDGERADNSDREIIVKGIDTGAATWGLAYAKKSKKLYIASNIRRFVLMKDADGDDYGDAGAIYMTDIDSNTTTRFFLATNNEVGYTPGITQTDRQVKKERALLDRDITKYVGRAGWGDIDLSEDENYLYAVNIGVNQLWKIDVNNPTSVEKFTITNPYDTSVCDNDMYHPWGLTIKDGKPYVGIICENNVSAGAAVVYFDDNIAKTLFITSSLGYNKAPGYQKDDAGNGDYLENFGSWDPANSDATWQAEPREAILADIEFDANGDIALGFVERRSHNRVTMDAGELLRVWSSR